MSVRGNRTYANSRSDPRAARAPRNELDGAGGRRRRHAHEMKWRGEHLGDHEVGGGLALDERDDRDAALRRDGRDRHAESRRRPRAEKDADDGLAAEVY